MMINRISSVQAQPNRMQTQNKQAKPAFGWAHYFTERPICNELLPEQENQAIINLTKKVSKGDFELKQVDSDKKVFKAKNGDTLEMSQGTSKTLPYINWNSEIDKDHLSIVRDNETGDVVKKSYDTLAKTLEEIKLNG